MPVVLLFLMMLRGRLVMLSMRIVLLLLMVLMGRLVVLVMVLLAHVAMIAGVVVKVLKAEACLEGRLKELHHW